MWTVVPTIYNAITAPHIRDSIFNCTYLRCYWKHLDNSMRVIRQTWCQIRRTSSSLRYVNCGPDHIQCNYSSVYSGFNIQLNRICGAIGDIPTFRSALHCKFDAKYSAHPPVYAMWTVVPGIYSVITAPHMQASIFNSMFLRCYWWYLENSMRLMLQTWCQIQRTSSCLRFVNCGMVKCEFVFNCVNTNDYEVWTCFRNAYLEIINVSPKISLFFCTWISAFYYAIF
jgi:hypothetical protein